MNSLAICVATMVHAPAAPDWAPGWVPTLRAEASKFLPIHVYSNALKNIGVVGAYQKLYEVSREDLLCYVHDDVIMRERGWDERVRKEFEDDRVGVVGFGGATQHGDERLYKVPYYLPHLARSGYRSNVDDAEVHGERFAGSCDVAVLDGFVLIVRRSLLDKFGSWDWIGRGCDFYCYDYAICAVARRLGYRVRVVGVRCHHLGGQTSVKGSQEAGGQGGGGEAEINGVKSVREITGAKAYEKSHRWFYDEFMDVMPCRIK